LIVVLPVPTRLRVRELAVSVLMSTFPRASVPPLGMLLVSVRLPPVRPVTFPLSVRLCVPEIVTACSVTALESERAALIACKVPEVRVSVPLARPPLLALASCSVEAVLSVVPPEEELLPAITVVPADPEIVVKPL